MKNNIGVTDRTVRITVGVSLLVWAFTGGPVWAYLGLLPLLTGLVRWCPAYSLLGLKRQKPNLDIPKR